MASLTRLNGVANTTVPAPKGACYSCRVSSLTLNYNCGLKKYSWEVGVDVNLEPQRKCKQKSGLLRATSIDVDSVQSTKATTLLTYSPNRPNYPHLLCSGKSL